MHTREARGRGETEERLYLLDAWRESPLYSDRERAALAWTEALTLISQTHAPDGVYDEVQQHFAEEEMVKLSVLVATINAWNRIAIGFRSLHPVKSAHAAAWAKEGSPALRQATAAALAALAAWLSAPAPRAAEPGDQIRRVSVEKLPNVPGKSLTAIVVSYAPGGRSGKHHHAGGVFAYVLSGAIRSENSTTGPAKVYQAGESFFEPPGSEHLVSENASTTAPASLLAIFVADDGAELTHFDD